ncbi:MAG: DNA polymerase IV [Candidatus Binatia bacterium]|nr:DNA polymerase IV [Candidatus Binatia bacterium]MDG2010225.1 DNA polymerase IV [Candidatus Binatia bacterium]
MEFRRDRIIFHADMDAFYASVEQRDRPSLRGRPVAVGGLPPRGVVTAASYEARAFGVRSAMPTSEALQRCPHLEVVPGNMKLYASESRKIRKVFDEFSPEVEPISLDEAFLDLTASMRVLGGHKEEIAQRLKDRVRAETGLCISVGIGPVKMVAKIASDLSKPDGLLVVEPSDCRDFLAPLPIRRLWGVGPVQEEKLLRKGIRTIGDLAGLVDVAPGSELARLCTLARGEDDRPVENTREARSIGEEQTFATDVRDRVRLREMIGQHAEAVARRLRRENLEARVVRLKIKSNEKLDRPGKYRIYTRQLTLPEPTQDGRRLRIAGHELLSDDSLPPQVRLLGLTAAGLQEVGVSATGQIDMFAGAPREDQSLNEALDKIQDRFGLEVIQRGGGARVSKASPSLGIKKGE